MRLITLLISSLFFAAVACGTTLPSKDDELPPEWSDNVIGQVIINKWTEPGQVAILESKGYLPVTADVFGGVKQVTVTLHDTTYYLYRKGGWPEAE